MIQVIKLLIHITSHSIQVSSLFTHMHFTLFHNTLLNHCDTILLIAIENMIKCKIELTLDNIMSAIEKGVVTKTTKTRLIKLETKLEELEKKILIKGKRRCKNTKRRSKKVFKRKFTSKAKKLIQSLIKTIIVYDDKIEITFNSPIEKNPETKTPGSFYLCKIIKHLTKISDNIEQEYTIDIEFYL